MAWTSGAFDGESYEGDWQDDKRNGLGVYKGADGSSYVGEWQDNKRNGEGVLK